MPKRFHEQVMQVKLRAGIFLEYWLSPDEGLIFSWVANHVGGAITPVAQGAIADRVRIHHAFVLPVICYLYIAYYALRASQPVGV